MNKLKKKQYMKQWRKNNRERLDKYNKQWFKDNPEYMEQWFKNNPDKRSLKSRDPKYMRKYHIDNREKILKLQKEYYKTEKGKDTHRRSNTKRNEREKLVINTLTSKEWLDILENNNYRCFYCGIEFDCENLPEKDHVIPISKGGHNTKENVVPACRSCNARKHNKNTFPTHRVKCEFV